MGETTRSAVLSTLNLVAGPHDDPLTDDLTVPLAIELAKKETLISEMLGALRSLPLESFGEDMSQCDAADFVDHAGEFFEAMLRARAVIAKAEGR